MPTARSPQIDIPDGSLAGPAAPPRTRSPSLSYDGEKIGLQAMFSHRQGETKREAIEAFGGNPQTLAAVHLGLAWIEKSQHKDGYWSLERIYHQERGEDYPGRGNQHSDSAATGPGAPAFPGRRPHAPQRASTRRRSAKGSTGWSSTRSPTAT